MSNNTKTESSPTTNVKRRPAAAYKWLIWRLPALCFWYWALALRSQELSLPVLRYIGLVTLLPVLRHFLRRRWWLGLVVIPVLPLYYVIGFPFIGVYWCAKLGRKVFTASQKTLRFVISASGFVLVFLFFIALLFLITNIKDPTALGILGFISVAATNALLLCGLAADLKVDKSQTGGREEGLLQWKRQ